jgi:hypothetical protein
VRVPSKSLVQSHLTITYASNKDFLHFSQANTISDTAVLLLIQLGKYDGWISSVRPPQRQALDSEILILLTDSIISKAYIMPTQHLANKHTKDTKLTNNPAHSLTKS